MFFDLYLQIFKMFHWIACKKLLSKYVHYCSDKYFDFRDLRIKTPSNLQWPDNPIWSMFSIVVSDGKTRILSDRFSFWYQCHWVTFVLYCAHSEFVYGPLCSYFQNSVTLIQYQTQYLVNLKLIKFTYFIKKSFKWDRTQRAKDDNIMVHCVEI
jgi:hypothetical protein